MPTVRRERKKCWNYLGPSSNSNSSSSTQVAGMLWCGRHRAAHHLRSHRKSFSLSLTSRLCHRGSSEATCAPPSNSPLEEVVGMRRQQAQRSLLVEVAGAGSAGELCRVCGQYGTVKALFHYTVPARGSTSRKEMILVEFQEASSVEEALRHSIYPTIKNCPPSYTPQVWLSAAGGGHTTTTTTTTTAAAATATATLTTAPPVTEEELTIKLAQCSSISEQVQTLHDQQRLTELGWRLRFFTCRQVEAALTGMFPSAVVLPFGSSVNSFGHRDSDLDMSLELGGDGSNGPIGGSGRLVFQGKASSTPANPRLTLQRRMEVVAELLDHFMPGCSQVRRILNARVPIIKYRQDLTAIDCDLTMANRSGYHMSRMLHLYGSADPRVAPLVCALRRWARSRGLTSPQAGRWLTNFSLTLLVLTYLMNTSPALLLPLTALKVTPGVDKETGDPTFTVPSESVISATAAAIKNTETLEALLRGFFAFYDKFNFRERGLSIVSGRDFVKPAHCALYIQNPLERDLNVSRNVTLEEVERLSTEVTHARYLMEAEEQGGDGSSTPNIWGAQRLWLRGGTAAQRHSENMYVIDWQAVFKPTEEGMGRTGKSADGKGGGISKNKEAGMGQRDAVDLTRVVNATERPASHSRPTQQELSGLVSKLKQKAQQRKTQPVRQTRKGKLKR